MMNCLDNTKNRLALVLLNNDRDNEKLYELIRKANNSCKNICYICLSVPHTNLIENLKEENIDCDKFIFVDAISSLQHSLEPTDNCIFIQGLKNMAEIKKAVRHAVSKKKCTLTIFDNLSSLLIYQTPEAIVRFTNEFITEDSESKINKIFVMLKEKGVYGEDSKRLVNDLHLFADKIIE